KRCSTSNRTEHTQGQIAVQSSNPVARDRTKVREDAPNEHFPIGLAGDRVNRVTWSGARIEGRIQFPATIEPSKQVKWRSVEVREEPADNDISVALHCDRAHCGV